MDTICDQTKKKFKNSDFAIQNSYLNLIIYYYLLITVEYLSSSKCLSNT